MPELGRLLPAFGQFATEQVHEQAIVEMAVAAALVLAHDADRAEAHRGVAADGLSVGGRRVNRDPVMTALVEQEPGEQPDSLAARALALETAAEVDVDPGMPVHRVVLLVVLYAPGDLAVDLHHQKHRRPASTGLTPAWAFPPSVATAAPFRHGRRRLTASTTLTASGTAKGRMRIDIGCSH